MDRDVEQAAQAILNGATPDWTDLESSDQVETRALTEQLKVLSAVAQVHRGSPDDRGEPPRLDRWGHLRLIEHVGAGAFGDVYRAWDTRLDREVALKLLPPDAWRAERDSPVIEEGRLQARVRHQNVATIYGAEFTDERVGLWMEFVHGRTLEELLRAGHPFGQREVLRIGLDLCRAVGAVHDAGLLHRDIKAQNVMCADDGRVVLTDFGTGRERADDSADSSGTPLYLAPEVLRGQPATVQSDIYSIGVLLFRLFSGTYPVRAATMTDLCRAHDHHERGDLTALRPKIPPAVAAVVHRALEASPDRRYESCGALAADLERLTRPSRAVARWWTAATIVAVAGALSGWAAWAARSAHAFGAAAVVPVAAHERPFIAVLPFTNQAAFPDSDLVVDGLTYELIRSLAVLDGLDVLSAASSFPLRQQAAGLQDIGRRLGVNLVLEGSVLESQGRWRVRAQLSRVDGRPPVWSGTFDGEGGLLTIQNRIAHAVVDQLRLALDAGQRRYDLDAATSLQYLKARALAERRGHDDTLTAVALFQGVIASDPSFAPAYAGLADAYAFMSQDLPDVGGLPPDRAVALMRPVAEKALELDPLLAEAHAAMGAVYARDYAWEAADRAFRRAIDLNPSLTHVYTSYALTTLQPMGRLDEAQAVLREALRRDPSSLIVLRDLGYAQLNAGAYDEAVRSLRAVRAVDPNVAWSDGLLARALVFAGHVDEAMPILESRASELGWQHWMAFGYVKAGRRADVERFASQHRNPYRLAIFYAALGDTDRALEALDRAATESPNRTARLLVYPEMAGLRADPRFQAIRARFNLH